MARPCHRLSRRICALTLWLSPALCDAQTGLATPAVTGSFDPLPEAVRPAPPPQPAAPMVATSNPVGPAPMTPASASAAPEVPGCRPVSERAMAADVAAARAKAQKRPLSEQRALARQAVTLWTQAQEQCDGRAQERARRNLNDNQRLVMQLDEQLESGPKCEKAHSNAEALQELARQGLSERRFVESAMLFRKAEDAWDLASEQCNGLLQETAEKRREQTAVDAHNAEFCAPVFEDAREQTHKLRGLAASVAREDKQSQSQVAETLWREAATQCKGAGAEMARSNAQALARERGTPWVAHRRPEPAPTPARRSQTSSAPIHAPGLPATSASASPKAPPAGAQAPSATPLAASAPRPAVPQPQPPEFTVDGTRFSGTFSRDAGGPTFSGTGTVRWPNGDQFQGTLMRGQRHGRGTFLWANGQRYEGDWQHDVATGKGTLHYSNGNRYQGDVLAGVAHGLGTMRYASGDEYRGRLRAGVPDGRGIYVWKNGQRFDGEWKDERPNGQGTLTFANGNVFEGSVRNGVPHGKGKLVFAGGAVYEGAIANGEPDGHGSYVWPNGDRYLGQWKAGKKHGHGVFTWKEGEHWEGEYEDDEQK